MNQLMARVPAISFAFDDTDDDLRSFSFENPLARSPSKGNGTRNPNRTLNLAGDVTRQGVTSGERDDRVPPPPAFASGSNEGVARGALGGLIEPNPPPPPPSGEREKNEGFARGPLGGLLVPPPAATDRARSQTSPTRSQTSPRNRTATDHARRPLRKLSTFDAKPPPPPRISKFWIGLTLTVQLLLLVIHIRGAFSLTYTLFDKSAQDGQVITDMELAQMNEFKAEGLYPAMELCVMFVYMSDPTAPIGPLEVTSTLLTVISRSLLSLSNHCYAGSYGFGYLFDGILLSLFVSYLCRSRRVLAKATFTTDQLHTYVYRTLPAVMVSAVTTFTFLYGESYSCLQEKRSEIAFPDVCEGTEGLGEDATGVCYTKAGECDDVWDSNALFTWCFFMVAATHLLILPFQTTMYTSSHLVRFDFSLGEQLQVILFAASMLLATFVFASSQEDGYATAEQLFTSRAGRSTLKGLLYGSLYMFMTCAAVTNNVFGSADFISHKLPVIAAFGQRLRSRMRTRQSAKLSPLLRFTVCSLSIFCFIPVGVSIIMIASGTARDERNLLRASSMIVFTFFLHTSLACIYFVSTPKGSQTSEVAFYVVTVTIHCVAVALVYVYMDEGISTIADWGLFWICGWWAYFLLKACRDYMALHSDNQIDRHFANSMAVLGGAVGPAVYLFAEAAGCVLTTEDYGAECSRLVVANSTTFIHLLVAAVFYLCSEITHLDLTMNDMIALNTDAGTVVRGMLQAFTWSIAMVVFGSRPRDSGGGGRCGDGDDYDEREEAAERLLIWVVVVLRYVNALVWLLLLAWEVIHFKHKIREEQLRTGERELGDVEDKRGWLARRSEKLWEDLNEWTKKNAVSEDVAKASPLFSYTACALTWVCVHPFGISIAQFAANGWEPNNHGVLMYQWGVSFKVAGCAAAVAYSFMDLEARSGYTYIDFHPWVTIVSAGLAEILCACIMLPGKIPYLNIFVLIAITSTAYISAVQREKAINEVSVKERRKHIYEVVFPAFFSLAPPLIFMTAEQATCYLKLYFTSEVDELVGNRQCDRIKMGIFPLTSLLTVITCSTVFFVNQESTFSLENICKLKISKMQCVEVVMFGFCAFYALTVYSLRKPGDFEDTTSQVMYMAYVGLLVSALVLSGFRPRVKGGGEEGGGGVELRERESAKSVWDGGTGGVTRPTTMKSVSKRGVREEREVLDGDGLGKKQASEMAFNPGFV